MFYPQIRRFVDAILNGRLLHHRFPCSADITDLVFLEIENNSALMTTYIIFRSNHSEMTVNSAIGRFVREVWNLNNTGREYKPQSTLIKTYMKHSN